MARTNLDYINDNSKLAEFILKQQNGKLDNILDIRRSIRKISMTPNGSVLLGNVLADLTDDLANVMQEKPVKAVINWRYEFPLVMSMMTMSQTHDHPLCALEMVYADDDPFGHVDGIGNVEPGSRVAIVSYVMKTGKEYLDLINYLSEHSLEPAVIIAIFDEEQGARELFKGLNIHYFNLFTRETLERMAKVKFKLPE